MSKKKKKKKSIENNIIYNFYCINRKCRTHFDCKKNLCKTGNAMSGHLSKNDDFSKLSEKLFKKIVFEKLVWKSFLRWILGKVSDFQGNSISR